MPAENAPLSSAQLTSLFREHQAMSITLRREPVNHRKQRLRQLRKWLHVNRKSIHEAMYADFRKNPTEVDSIELLHVLSEIKHALYNLSSWTSPQKVDAPLIMLGTRSFIQHEARGVCLIISPWNYPLSLCIGPLVSALAAGNTVVLKPSELTPHVSALIKRMGHEVFPSGHVSVVEGDADIGRELLKFPFDHIFFTGSPTTGKLVMKAAAENLSSVTLELGGKSPAIVMDEKVVSDAARRIAFTKFINNGQTCIAPDYVLVDEKISRRFIEELIVETKKLFTDKDGDFESSAHYCRIVNARHYHRLLDLLKDAMDLGAKMEFGGKMDSSKNFFHPTILSGVPDQSRMMDEEIFGPILPVIIFRDLEEAIALVNGKPKALALYIFSAKANIQRRLLEETSSGGVCINDCGIQFMHSNLPFGGVNNSGIGKCHGYYGFLAFSNKKGVLKQRLGITIPSIFYPPYTPRLARLVAWFLKRF